METTPDFAFTHHDDLPTADARVVDDGLERANAAAAPMHEVRPLACFARRADGSVVGGAIGRTWGECCQLQQLWVDPALRQRGIATRLLAGFEGRATARGCRRIYLDTFSFQAPAFYRARGFEVALEIAGYGPGIVMTTMLKAIGPDARAEGPRVRGRVRRMTRADASRPSDALNLRPIVAADAAAVAALHVASWRVAYRGILRDDYLDGPIADERDALWRARLAAPPSNAVGVLAEDARGAIGFAWALVDADPVHGSHLDNLHVSPEARGGGIGTRIVQRLCTTTRARARHPGFWLWAHEANRAACAYYEHLGGERFERAVRRAPDGEMVAGWRYVWPRIEALEAATRRK